jgi:hypothetical protein
VSTNVLSGTVGTQMDAVVSAAAQKVRNVGKENAVKVSVHPGRAEFRTAAVEYVVVHRGRRAFTRNAVNHSAQKTRATCLISAVVSVNAPKG